MLDQSIGVLEWAQCWSECREFVQRVPLPPPLRSQTLACLEEWKAFSESGSLLQLDPCWGEIRRLLIEWDHWWWVAERSGQAWPSPESGRRGHFEVTRQGQRSRVSWNCPQCAWQVSWDVEVASWETVPWPGPMECPLCSSASSGDPSLDENPPIESER